jgi:GTP-binding protein
MILDAWDFPARQDATVAHLAHASGKPLLIGLNKWDLIQGQVPSSEEIKKRVYRRLDFVNYAPLLSISALTGKRVVKILEIAEEVYRNGCQKIQTSRLNKFLAWMNERHPPLSRSKRRIKVKYMTQKRVLPPTFVLFTHSRVSLSPSYERFFVQNLRSRFVFWGNPIRIILRES